MSDSDPAAPRGADVLVRLTNAPEDTYRCAPAYHVFNEFIPNESELAETPMFTLISRDDFYAIVAAVNTDLATFRKWQRLSSLTAAFGTLLCIIVIIFQIYVGVSIQIVLLLIHVILTKELRKECMRRIGKMLSVDVNPHIQHRAIELRLSEHAQGCVAAAWLCVDVCKLPGFDVRRRRLTLNRPTVVALECDGDDVPFDAIVVGEPISPPVFPRVD